jgi:hypothetical protein
VQPFDPVREEIRSAMSKAHALRHRGDSAGAENVMREIVAKYPEHPDALEANAELLIDQNKLPEARDLLARVIAEHPGRISTERRHAEIVLRIANKDAVVQRLLTGDMGDIMNPAGVKRHAATGGFFSLLLPGFGQIYNGEFVKGICFASSAVVLWIGLFALGMAGGGGKKSQLTGFFWPILVLLLTIYIVGIADASVAAARSTPAPPPDRPKPPVDKPF